MKKIIKQGNSIIDFGNMDNQQINKLMEKMNNTLFFIKDNRTQIEKEYDGYIHEMALYEAEDGMHAAGILMIANKLKLKLSLDDYKNGKRL